MLNNNAKSRGALGKGKSRRQQTGKGPTGKGTDFIENDKLKVTISHVS